MALNLLLHSLLFLLYHLPQRSLANAAGTLAFFLDEQCEQASIINPTVNLAVDTCLVTPGALGIAVQLYPSCPSGNATYLMYRDTSCANALSMDLQYNNCYFDGPDGVPAVRFVCNKAAATATSTVAAGSSSIPVALDTPGTSTASTVKQTGPASNGGGAITTTSPSSSTSPAEPSQTNTTSGGGKGGGISQSTQVILGVVLPVGGILVALLAWWFPKMKRR